MVDDPYAAAGARSPGNAQQRPVAPRGPQPNVREQRSLADLADKYAETAGRRQQLDLDRRRVAAAELAARPPKSAAQLANEARASARGNVLGEKAATQEFSLPKLEQSVSFAFKAAEDLLAHPGFEAHTGLPNPFKGGFGVLGDVTGTPAGDFRTALTGAMAEAFVPAFEALKGAGAISAVEGAASLASLANFGEGMSEVQFTREVQKYTNKLAAGLEVARKQAGMGGTPFTYGELVAEKRRREALKGQR